MNELPKALTADERDALYEGDQCSIERALEWIDAATELLAEQAAQIVLDGRRIAELEARLNGH